MDKTVKELYCDLKSYSTLTDVNRQIRLNPGQKNNVKAFIQWTRYQYRLGLDPALTLFSVTNISEYIKRYKHHEAYIEKSSTLTDIAKPEQFTDKMKWIDWYKNLIFFKGNSRKEWSTV